MFSRHYILSVDIGQITQPTAIAIIEQESSHSDTGWKSEIVEMRLRHLERMDIDAGYPELAARVRELMKGLEDKENGPAPDLLVDITGAGTAPAGLMRGEDLEPISVLITNGAGEQRGDDGVWHLGKAELVGVLQVSMQSDKLKVAKSMPLISTFVQELENFKMRPLTLKPEDGEYWREGQNDDLVLAVGIAAWWAEKEIPTPKAAYDAQTRRMNETLDKRAGLIV
jgi:hypothetical protein